MNLDFCNDQPGRLVALIIVAPILFYKGLKYNDLFIIAFSIVLFLWDLYWLVTSKPNSYIEKNENANNLEEVNTENIYK